MHALIELLHTLNIFKFLLIWHTGFGCNSKEKKGRNAPCWKAPPPIIIEEEILFHTGHFLPMRNWGGGGGELPHSGPFAIFWSIPKTGYYTPPPPPPPWSLFFIRVFTVSSRFHGVILHHGPIVHVQATSTSATYLLCSHSTTVNRGPSPHGFTSKMCWCIDEMLVLNSADAKLSQKDSCIQWFQSLRSVLGLFLCRGQRAISTFVFIGTGNWSKERSLILRTCSERRELWIVR